MILVRKDQNIPLFVAMEDESTDRIITANLIDPSTGELIYANLELDLVATTPGFYKNTDVLMPDLPTLRIIYSIYTSDGMTLLGKAEDYISQLEYLTNFSGGSSSAFVEVFATVEDMSAICADIEDDEILITVVANEEET